MPPHDDAEDFAGDIAFEAANGLQVRITRSDAFGNVLLQTWVYSQAPDSDGVTAWRSPNAA